MGGARARNHSRKHRIGEDHRTKIAGERGLAKRRKRFKSNTVDPSVWAITKRFESAGKLHIPEMKFANKLQAILNASAEEKHIQFELTQNSEVRMLLIEALSTYPDHREFLRQLKDKSKSRG